ncbi:uncharacterized protein LOC115229956 [Argonauta hians]
MSTTGIEVRRPNPSVATVWVAELLAAANKQMDDVENRKTYESINRMFGKNPSNHEAAPMSLEEKFTHRINKQKRKLDQKEKEVENTVKKKKKKANDILPTSLLNKAELVTKKKKTPKLMNGTKTETSSDITVQKIKLRLQNDTLSRTTKKKLRRKLKILLNKSNDETVLNGTGKAKTVNNLTKEKVKENINNYHKVAPSPVKMNGHHVKPDITLNMTNGTSDANGIHNNNNKKQKYSQLTQTKQDISSNGLLKKKKKKRSKQKNIKKDNRPDHLKPGNQVKNLTQNKV